MRQSVLNRVVGEAGLEPAKAYASGFTVRPLCHSGHSPDAFSTEPALGLPDETGPARVHLAEANRLSTAHKFDDALSELKAAVESYPKLAEA